jgi:hypothetical protein
LANKQYISIIRLLQHAEIDVESEINVARVKKQLAAEFNFSPTAIIEIDNYSYNKTDVFEELDTRFLLIVWLSTRNLGSKNRF